VPYSGRRRAPLRVFEAQGADYSKPTAMQRHGSRAKAPVVARMLNELCPAATTRCARTYIIDNPATAARYHAALQTVATHHARSRMQ
jgi:hypothetical protein